MIKRKKRNTKWDEICNYLEVNQKRDVFVDEIAKTFEYRNRQSIIALFNNYSCLEYTSKKILGINKKSYLCKHDIIKHQNIKYQEITKQQLRKKTYPLGLAKFEVLEDDIYSNLIESEKFVEELDFEVHAVRYSTNPDIVLPGLYETDYSDTLIEWEWCNYRILVMSNTLFLQMVAKKKYKKYGLNKARYKAFIRHRNKTLRELFGWDIFIHLQVIQFDLHQDDWRFEWDGTWKGANIIVGVYDEYALTLQRYAVLRKEHPRVREERRMKRFEVRFKNRKAVRDLYDIIPKVLSLDADRVEVVGSITSLTKELNRSIDFHQQQIINWTNLRVDEETRISKIAEDLNMVKESLRDFLDETQMEKLEPQLDEITQTLSDLNRAFQDEQVEQYDFRTGQTQILEQNTVINRQQTDILSRYEGAMESVLESLDGVKEEVAIAHGSLMSVLKPRKLISRLGKFLFRKK